MFFLIVVLPVLIFCEKKVLMTIVLSRHCDRTPFSEFNIPKFGVDLNEVLNQTMGKLTLLGEYECYKLGDALRKRYLDSKSEYFIKDINPVYQSIDYQLISTSYDRTIRSGAAVSMGLFPPKNGYELDVFPFGYPLPGGVQSVPYHSTDLKYDKSLLGFDPERCPQLQKNRDAFFSSKEGQRVLSDNSEKMQRILEGTGLNTTIPTPHANFIDIYYIWDYVIAVKQHGFLPKYFSNDYFNVTRDVTFESYYYQFRRSIVGNLGGGLFLGEVLTDIDNFIATIKSKNNDFKEKKKKNTRSRYGGDNWSLGDGSNPKFIHYSAHDQTISVVLSNLGLIDSEDDLRKEIDFGSALIFEVWGDDNYEELEIKIVFKDGWKGDKNFFSYRLPLVGESGDDTCLKENCNYEVFSRILRHQCVISEEVYCENCGVDKNGGIDSVCLQVNFGHLKSKFKKDEGSIKNYKGWLMAISILCVVFYICCICMCVPACLTCITSEILSKKKKKEEEKHKHKHHHHHHHKRKNVTKHYSRSWDDEELLSDAGNEQDEFLIKEEKNQEEDHQQQKQQQHDDDCPDCDVINGEDGGELVDEKNKKQTINYESTDYI